MCRVFIYFILLFFWKKKLINFGFWFRMKISLSVFTIKGKNKQRPVENWWLKFVCFGHDENKNKLCENFWLPHRSIKQNWGLLKVFRSSLLVWRRFRNVSDLRVFIDSEQQLLGDVLYGPALWVLRIRLQKRKLFFLSVLLPCTVYAFENQWSERMAIHVQRFQSLINLGLRLIKLSGIKPPSEAFCWVNYQSTISSLSISAIANPTLNWTLKETFRSFCFLE